MKKINNLVRFLRKLDIPKREIESHKYNLKTNLLINYSSIKEGGEFKIMNKNFAKFATLGFAVLALFVGYGLIKPKTKITVPGTKVNINLNPQVQAQELARNVLSEIEKLNSEERKQLEENMHRKIEDVQISLQEALKASDLRIINMEEYEARNKALENTGDFIVVSKKNSKKEISKFIAYTDTNSRKEVLVGIDQKNMPLYWETMSK